MYLCVKERKMVNARKKQKSCEKEKTQTPAVIVPDLCYGFASLFERGSAPL